MIPKRPSKSATGSARAAHATLGALFRSRREALGFPVERAAHETKIRAARLKDLEADDLSRIQPAYARMFVRDYARYLKIPDSEISPYLPDAGAFGVEGYEYIRNAPGNLRSDHIHPPRPPRSRRKVVLRIALACLLVAGGFQAWVTWKKLERIRASASGFASAGDRALLGDNGSVIGTTDGRSAEIEDFRAVGEADRPASLADGMAAEAIPLAGEVPGTSHF